MVLFWTAYGVLLLGLSLVVLTQMLLRTLDADPHRPVASTDTAFLQWEITMCGRAPPPLWSMTEKQGKVGKFSVLFK